ncbi:MAG: hypothetical protein V3V62_01755 [bacterium]
MMTESDGKPEALSGQTTRRELLVKGVALLPYVVPVVITVLAGAAEAHHQAGHRSCPPGFIRVKKRCIPQSKDSDSKDAVKKLFDK